MDISQWSTYTCLYWSRVYFHFDEKKIIFPKESILLWGFVPYTLYKNSSFYNTNKIIVNNEDLNVYYYVRKICRTSSIKFFAFVNVIGVKDLVEMSMDEDSVFIKSLYDSKIGIHCIFDHEFKDDCWRTLMEENIE